MNNHFHEDLHQLLVLIYTHRVSGSQQYKRARAGIETYPVSVCFLACTFSLSHHLSPNGRILESLIIFTAHSIIPAKRLIHDLPQWRPTPPSQGEGEAKQERKSASVRKFKRKRKKKTYIISDVYYFEFSCRMRSIFFCQTGRKRVVKAFIRLRSHRVLYPSNTRERCSYCSAITLMACQGKSSPKISESLRKIIC